MISIKIQAPSSPAVYSLCFGKSPDKKYYGSTGNLRNRIRGHLGKLEAGCHHSFELQTDFYKYGGDLYYEILKTGTKEEMLQEERCLIFKDGPSYNTRRPIATAEEILELRKKWMKKRNAEARIAEPKRRIYEHIYWRKRDKRWSCVPSIYGIRFNLGDFINIEDAKTALDSFSSNPNEILKKLIEKIMAIRTILNSDGKERVCIDPDWGIITLKPMADL